MFFVFAYQDAPLFSLDRHCRCRAEFRVRRHPQRCSHSHWKRRASPRRHCSSHSVLLPSGGALCCMAHSANRGQPHKQPQFERGDSLAVAGGSCDICRHWLKEIEDIASKTVHLLA